MEITCNICLLTSPNPMKASCGHVFCWRCLFRMLDSPPPIPGQAKPCPACSTITVPEVVSDVATTEPTPNLTDEDDITDTITTPLLPDLPPSHDAHIMENGLDHRISKNELVDNLQGVAIHRGVISRTWNFLSKRYGNAIEEYIAIHRDLVDERMSVEGAPLTALAAPNIPE